MPGTRHEKGSAKYPVSQSFMVLLAGTHVAQQCIPMHVPPGSTVRVRATNGAAGNAAVIFVGTDRLILQSGQGTPLMPLDDVEFPTDSAGQLWAYGTAGDGVVISIVRQFGI
ncbi:MAG TPA: hypothetical protein VMW51_09770 [Terriglobia bacterium]|nr:hypothetical protein [Terriglobia bacterium]